MIHAEGLVPSADCKLRTCADHVRRLELSKPSCTHKSNLTGQATPIWSHLGVSSVCPFIKASAVHRPTKHSTHHPAGSGILALYACCCWGSSLLFDVFTSDLMHTYMPPAVWVLVVFDDV
ncbi:hypothetical protein BS78_07G140600 [Paspalum vaginatum]|nr:hypothetical protein BS78_07G140600 [Paspalum vaginatum]KAJ1268502.1 hypothetical protein BS78_07G140600 [Paspalum vaginatum]KAJ1268503.1 hypothetical protein BS78_07G140600 [Paspalum vaginatum]KAJ1268504.1 hypothetical protein BS78_07G140600 [Paspalum vaginatum]